MEQLKTTVINFLALYGFQVVGINALGDSSIKITIKPWVKVPDYAATQLELYQAIVEQFRARQIEIPFPQREVRMLDGTVAR